MIVECLSDRRKSSWNPSTALKIPPSSQSSASPSPTQPRILLPDLPGSYIHSTAADQPSPARFEPSAYHMEAFRVAKCDCSWMASSRLTAMYFEIGRWLGGRAWTTVVWPSMLAEVGGVNRASSVVLALPATPGPTFPRGGGVRARGMGALYGLGGRGGRYGA